MINMRPEQSIEQQPSNHKPTVNRRVFLWPLIPGLVFVTLRFLPRDILIAPRWKVEVVDTKGRPLPGLKVQQMWRHYGLETTMHRGVKVADDHGIVVFDRRLIRASAVGRIVGTVRAFFQAGFHSSYRPLAEVLTAEGGSKFETEASSRNPTADEWYTRLAVECVHCWKLPPSVEESSKNVEPRSR